jgi:hypothetical protein
MVVVGSLTNTIYEVKRQRVQVTHRLYEAQYHGDASVLIRTHDDVSVESASEEVHIRGVQYSVEAGVFHESSVPETQFTATLVTTTPPTPLRPLIAGELAGEARYEYSRSIVDSNTRTAILTTLLHAL